MKIFILGTGKSGTTALVYKIAEAIPHCRAFSGGKPGKYMGDYENAVYKHTYEERKGKSFELYREHLNQVHYDRKIWMARDPRDVAVSRMLYRWHRGYTGQKKQYEAHLNLVLQKERDPRSVSFCEICRYTDHKNWPVSENEVFETERVRYAKMTDFVRSLEDDWFVFKYEDMVNNRVQQLNQFLGFAVKNDAEVPQGTGKEKVVRKKAFGDWRHWLTEEDVELFKPAYNSYMEAIGYDTTDWEISAQPVIEPRFSSEYLQNIARKAKKNFLMRYLDNVAQRFRN
jgi:hypothetical protein